MTTKARNTYGLTPIGKIITHGWVDNGYCWVFSGPKNSKGYGKIGHKGSTLAAHRVMYEGTKGTINEGEVVRHTCDNPSCVNPLHLVVGTHQDNSDDKVSRYRHMYRAGHPRAKLTEEDVVEIRGLINSGTMLQQEIADKFGVSGGTISHIKTGRGWK